MEARRFATSARRALTGVPPSQFRLALEQIAEWAVKRER
jgi:hypothetical protein